MNEFWLWFTTGFQHILDWNGYDHILYVMVLCVLFSMKEWKSLLILITAFTIGHSLTLAASTFHIITIKQSLIEVLIPLTIITTCVSNIYFRNKQYINYQFNYALALFFGFIHGMGFSYILTSLLGKEESILLPLVSFNIGLEVGQLCIVTAMLLFSVFLIRFTRIKPAVWVTSVSSAVLIIAAFLFIQRLNHL
jgi:hypothetical protein